MSDASYAENIARKQRLAAKFNIELLIYLPAELRNVSELVKSLNHGFAFHHRDWYQTTRLSAFKFLDRQVFTCLTI